MPVGSTAPCSPGGPTRSGWTAARRRSPVSRFTVMGDCTGPARGVPQLRCDRDARVRVAPQMAVWTRFSGRRSSTTWTTGCARGAVPPDPALPVRFPPRLRRLPRLRAEGRHRGPHAHRSPGSRTPPLVFADRALVIDHDRRLLLPARAEPDGPAIRAAAMVRPRPAPIASRRCDAGAQASRRAPLVHRRRRRQPRVPARPGGLPRAIEQCLRSRSGPARPTRCA